jgi:hypothetical protein
MMPLGTVRHMLFGASPTWKFTATDPKSPDWATEVGYIAKKD